MKRRILLTGGSRGIGAALREYLEVNGEYTVAAPVRSELNLSDSESMANYLRDNHDYDILINNAAINVISAVDEFDGNDLDSMLQVNLRSVFQILKAVVPGMKARNYGRIVNVSSVWGIRSKEMRSMYSMTKFGMNGISRSLARELGPWNVLVNSICPGYVNTEMTRKNVPPNMQAEIKKEIPLRRFADPAELAPCVEFLISDRNTYVTGQEIVIDGGFLA